MHPGHVTLFRECKRIAGTGGTLIVSVNSTEFIERFKHRPPVQSTEERLGMVHSVRFVDRVIVNDSENLKPIIEEAMPDFIVIGSDWGPPRDYYAQIGVTPQWLETHDIALLYLDRHSIHSSTELKDRIRG